MAARDRSLGLAPASVRDYRELARRRLPRQLFDYLDGGAYEESTMRANVADLGRIRLRQRVLRDVSDLRLGTTVLGEDLALPLVLAPVGLAGMFARRAEIQAARAAETAGISFCESAVSICGIEEVRAATTRPFWFQLYVMRDRGYAEDLMGRASAAGCAVLVLTVDLAVVGARYRDTRNGMTDPVSLPKRLVRAWDLASHPAWVRDVALGGRPLTFANLERAVPGARTPDAFRGWVDTQFDPSVTWDDLAWVRDQWRGKLVLKGILDPDDALRAADHGADAVVVSNHGGRRGRSGGGGPRRGPDGFSGAPGRIRTCDTRFRKPVLYPLSYEGLLVVSAGQSPLPPPPQCDSPRPVPRESRGAFARSWRCSGATLPLLRRLTTPGEIVGPHALGPGGQGQLPDAVDGGTQLARLEGRGDGQTEHVQVWLDGAQGPMRLDRSEVRPHAWPGAIEIHELLDDP